MSATWLSLGLILALFPSQPAAVRAEQVEEGWRWTRFTTRSGLPSDRIDLVVVDGEGRPWVGTSYGLAWFDGYGWQAAHECVPRAAPSSLVRDADGGVLAVVDGRTFAGDTEGFTELALEIDGRPVRPQRVLPLADGRLAARDPDRPSAILLAGRDGQATSIRTPESPTGRVGREIWHTPDGDLYVSGPYGLYRRAGRLWTPWIETDIASPRFLAEENDLGQGVAAISLPRDGFHVWWWDTESEPRPLSGPDEVGIRDVAIGLDGRIVVTGTADRVLLRETPPGAEPEGDDDEWRQLVLPREMRSVRCVEFDRQGDLWIGSGTGLFKYRLSSKLWTRIDDGGTGTFNEVLVASDGSLWAAPLEGIRRLHDGMWEPLVTEAAGYDLGRSTALGEDELGRIWVGSGGAYPGCLRFDGTAWTYIGKEDGLGAEYVHKIREDRDGRLWFLGLYLHESDGPGAFVRLEEDRYEHWGVAKGLPSGRVYDFQEGPDGAYWFATLGGISRFRDGDWTHWTEEEGLDIDRVFTLAVEHSGRVWFGHHGWNGLGYLDDDVVHYDLRGMPNEEVWELTVDDAGRLWIGTAAGASVQVGDKRVHLAEGTGLYRTHVWPICPAGDKVYFGTLNAGLVALDLGEVDLTPPRVTIDRPRGDGERETLRWDVASPDGWVPAHEIQTRWRLEDEPWSPWGLQREIPMPPQDAVVTVQALGYLGAHEPEGTSRELFVTRSLYRDPLFVGPLVLLSVSVLGLAVALVARKRRHAAELRSSEQRYRGLFENANDMIFTSDLDGRIQTANRKTREVLGIDQESVEGLRLADLADPAHAERCREAHERVLAQGESGLYELDLVLPGGRAVSIELNTRRVGDPGAPTGLQTVARDVTGRREVEGERRHAHKMEALGVLAGGVAHDFNNVLSVILGYSDVLIERVGKDSPLRRDLEEIRKAGERATSLTSQLLAFGRKQVLRTEVFELGELVGEMEPMLRALLGEAVELRVDPGGGRAMLELDPGQVQQVVLNLAANARDAMKHGGRLTIEVDVIELDAADAARHEGLRPGPHVRLEVRDTGPGMDEETRRRIFDPFFTTKAPGKGTGLGLSSVYGIVQQSEGSISVRTAPGEGASFQVLLPRTDTLPRRKPAPAPPRDGGGSECILVVEDEDSVREILVNSLSRQGYTIYEAANAAEAQRIAREVGGSIDLLVTDVVMPGLSGSELAERLTIAYPDLRVLFVSGYAGDALGRHALGAHDVLYKPFGVDAFARRVREVLEGERTRAGADA